MRIGMRRRTRNRLWLFGVMWIVSMLSGLLYGHLFLGDDVSPWIVMEEVAIGAVLVWGGLLFVLPSRLGRPINRLAFLPRLAVIVAFILAVIPLTDLITDLFDGSGVASLDPTLPMYFFALGVVAVAAVVIEVMHMIGPRVLGSLLIGRYQRPVEEDRVFLIVDIAGSTKMAHRLGALRYQRLLCRFYFDIGEPILEAGGEIHAYVGDGMIVTWRRRQGDARPVSCFFEIQDVLHRNRGYYQRFFEAEPRVRGAVHGGRVVMSACGYAKRAIVYFGDTLSATARLEEQAKKWDRDLVATAEFAATLDLPDDVAVEKLGPVVLRGLDGEAELASFVRPGSGKAPQSVLAGGALQHDRTDAA